MKTLIPILLLICSSVTLADPEQIRDPMRPPNVAEPGQAAAPQAAPVVSAVFISSTRRVAVVHGRVVRAGDSVGTCLVDEVVPDGIRCHEGASLHVPGKSGTAVAFRTPAATPAVAANGEEQ
jgi:hypothetical protein